MDIAHSPYVELTFDKTGRVTGGSIAEIASALDAANAEDLVVVSHGWKFEDEEPRRFYQRLWPHAARALGPLDPRRVVLVGISWPSKRYSTTIDETLVVASDGSGALAASAAVEDDDAEDAAVEAAVRDTANLFDDADVAVHAANYLAETDPEAAEALLEKLIDAALAAPEDAELTDERIALEDAREMIGIALAQQADPPQVAASDEVVQALGLGDAIARVFRGPRAALVRLLEQLSFFEMKQRAGVVGRQLGIALSGLSPARDTRLHLVGHSFGARLVTSAADALQPPTRLSLQSLTLLQGAYSHNGLSASRNGAFRGVVGKVQGPIVITHTHNDRALTIAYALASRLSRDTTSNLGDASDAFGALGANGAQAIAPTAAAGTMPFSPARGRVTNYRADTYVVKVDGQTDAHNNVANPTVGKLIAAAVRAQ